MQAINFSVCKVQFGYLATNSLSVSKIQGVRVDLPAVDILLHWSVLVREAPVDIPAAQSLGSLDRKTWLPVVAEAVELGPGSACSVLSSVASW